MKPLVAYSLEIEEPLERAQLVDRLIESKEPALVLHTCQRLECYGPATLPFASNQIDARFEEMAAFERLARIAAGLESRVLGELEVLGQVRNAYKTFHQTIGHEQTRLDRVFQDAIALARKARRDSGIDQNLTSLSGLAARELLDRCETGVPLCVVGTGSIAGSAARYLGKRGNSPVRVTSRCPDRALSLALEVGGFGAGLDAMCDLFDGVAGIITATAAPHPVVYPQHIERANHPLTIIDLGEPADCNQQVRESEQVHYLDLLEIEQRAHVNTDERKACAEVANRIIKEGAITWSSKR